MQVFHWQFALVKQIPSCWPPSGSSSVHNCERSVIVRVALSHCNLSISVSTSKQLHWSVFRVSGRQRYLTTTSMASNLLRPDSNPPCLGIYLLLWIYTGILAFGHTLWWLHLARSHQAGLCRALELSGWSIFGRVHVAIIHTKSLTCSFHKNLGVRAWCVSFCSMQKFSERVGSVK